MINIKVDSALHVFKGAVQKVLGASLTIGTFAEGDHGRLTVEFDREPTQEEMQKVEEEANNKIKENAEIKILEMKRDEAEKEFGNKIYDKFPVPAHIKDLKIVVIEDWNWNCCIGQHYKTTGGIVTIKIANWRFRGNRNELEISFDVM